MFADPCAAPFAPRGARGDPYDIGCGDRAAGRVVADRPRRACGAIGPAVPVARATGGVDGVFTHTTSTDFSVCTDLTGTIPAPVITSLTLSSTAGGELRLTPTLEDYFDGSTVDTGLWVSGTAQTFYTSTVEVADGVAILDGTYLRSQENFQATQPRFFEARARHLISGTNAGWPDLGFYRELPPFAYTGTLPADSALRIFVTRNDNSTFLRGRDGGSGAPLYDVEVDPDPDPSLYHTYRIEWDAGSAAETRFFIDGEAVGVITGSSDLHTWVFGHRICTPGSFCIIRRPRTFIRISHRPMSIGCAPGNTPPLAASIPPAPKMQAGSSTGPH